MVQSLTADNKKPTGVGHLSSIPALLKASGMIR